MGIAHVLFDYSGVLTTGLALPDEELPFDADAMVLEMYHALSTTDPHPWQQLERGEIALTDFCDHVESVVEGGSIMFAADSRLNIMANLEMVDERIALARSLRNEGLSVGLVSNNVAEWAPHWLPRLPAGLFDPLIDSAQVGMRKPEPGIYELALDHLGNPDPATVLFIDDFEWNVLGAEAVGMQGLVCPGGLDLSAAIRERLS